MKNNEKLRDKWDAETQKAYSLAAIRALTYHLRLYRRAQIINDEVHILYTRMTDPEKGKLSLAAVGGGDQDKVSAHVSDYMEKLDKYQEALREQYLERSYTEVYIDRAAEMIPDERHLRRIMTYRFIFNMENNDGAFVLEIPPKTYKRVLDKGIMAVAKILWETACMDALEKRGKEK